MSVNISYFNPNLTTLYRALFSKPQWPKVEPLSPLPSLLALKPCHRLSSSWLALENLTQQQIHFSSPTRPGKNKAL